MALTRRQRQVLDIITEFIGRHGYSPSLEEIGTTLGLSSVATVHKHVTHLVHKGYVRRTWNQNRSIEPAALDAAGAQRVPIAGVLVAGKPIDHLEPPQELTVPADWLRDRVASHALRARGDGLLGEHIRDGDQLIVEERRSVRDGETVVAVLDDDSAVLGRHFRAGTRVRIERSGSEGLLVPAHRIRIHGVLVGVIRRC
jgi:repressor LexA